MISFYDTSPTQLDGVGDDYPLGVCIYYIHQSSYVKPPVLDSRKNYARTSEP
jgi:hypothetical protein